MEGQTDGGTGRWRFRQTEGQTDRHTDKQTDSERQTEGQTDTHDIFGLLSER